LANFSNKLRVSNAAMVELEKTNVEGCTDGISVLS
jgi:hypothetical protein